MKVENFGFFIVESDLAGNRLFEQTSKGFEELYQGSKSAALSRYGETDSRDDELI